MYNDGDSRVSSQQDWDLWLSSFIIMTTWEHQQAFKAMRNMSMQDQEMCAILGDCTRVFSTRLLQAHHR